MEDDIKQIWIELISKMEFSQNEWKPKKEEYAATCDKLIKKLNKIYESDRKIWQCPFCKNESGVCKCRLKK